MKGMAKMSLFGLFYLLLHMFRGTLSICDHVESNFMDVIKNMESNNTSYIICSGNANLSESIIPHNRLSAVSNISLVGKQGNAIVTCVSHDNLKHAFIFDDIYNLSISGITFKGCGGDVPNHTRYSKRYTYINAAVFLFYHCEQVNITNVNITKYNGTAMIFLNAGQELRIQHVNIVRNAKVPWPLGGGIQLDFFDNHNSTTNVTIAHVNISNSKQQNCKHFNRTYYFMQHNNYYPVWQAQGLTINFNQRHSQVFVQLINLKIFNNTGCNCSGVFVQFNNLLDSSHLEIYDSSLTNNNISKGSLTSGSSLLVFFVKTNDTNNTDKYTVNYDVDRNNSIQPIQIHDSQINNHSRTPIHMLNMRDDDKFGEIFIILSNITFQNNFVTDQAICLSVVSLYDSQTDNANIQVNMTNIRASQNRQKHAVNIHENVNQAVIPPVSAALFLFINLDTVNIECNLTNCNSSDVSFSFNNASVFLGIATDFLLKGNLLFNNNTAEVGACFQLHSFSHIFLEDGVKVHFYNNSAYTFGGAIISFSEGNEYSMCFLQLSEMSSDINSMQIYFLNNSAGFGGDDIYGDQIFNCFLKNQDITTLYEKIIYNYSSMHNKQNIISKPFFVKYNKTNKTVSFYPGGTVVLHLKVVGTNGNSVPAYIFSSISSEHKTNFRLSSSTFSYNYIQTNKSHSEWQEYHFRIFVGSTPLRDSDDRCLKLFLSTPYGIEYTDVTLKIDECPSGYHLDSKQQKCVCYNFLANIVSHVCDIDELNNTLKTRMWMHCIDSVTLNKSPLCKYTDQCLKGYCKDKISITDISNEKLLCDGNRNGVVCGSCVNGYSVQFGTRNCIKCQNNIFILFPLVAGIFGILLVFTIYFLKLTLDHGTLGGVIFYANVIQLGMIRPSAKRISTEISFWFVAMINLEIGSPVCFYDGMTDLHKHFFRFLFPAYMCLIVLFIIIISRRSIRISNLTSHLSVQVLVTIMHLMFASFSLSVFESFSILRLNETRILTTTLANGSNQMDYNTSSSVVWLYSGDVPYGKRGHLVLLMVSGLVFLIILLPYLILSIIAPCLYCNPWINKFKPVFDTMYGPYKDKYRHWFGYRLFTVWLISATFAVTLGLSDNLENHIRTTILLVYTFSLALQQPFKSNILNYLEIWFSVNVSLCGILEMHDYESHVCNSKIALILMAFATFCIIFLYHLLLTFKLLPHCNNILSKYKRRLRFRSINETESAILETSVRDSDYGSSINRNNQLRESLLASVSYREED